MAGWSSANKYSLMGGLRAAGQLIAYELPLVLATVGVVVMAGTMSLEGIVEAQAGWFSETGWAYGFPFVIPQFVGFVIFMIAALAELSRIPFDMPIAESELVMGYLTEYSGFRFLFFFLAEFANMFTMAAIAATLFLGGYWAPGALRPRRCSSRARSSSVARSSSSCSHDLVPLDLPPVPRGPAAVPRLEVAVPISLANIVVTGAFKVVF
jgi:NADH-quinone oxidoreductase subunit H